MLSNQTPARPTHVLFLLPCHPPPPPAHTKRNIPLRICCTASFPIWAAVKPCRDTSVASAPYPNNSLQVCRWPASAARCNAVWPSVSRAFTCTHKHLAVRTLQGAAALYVLKTHINVPIVNDLHLFWKKKKRSACVLRKSFLGKLDLKNPESK